MKKLISGLLIIGFATQIFAQNVPVQKINEIVISAVNYKYLDAVDSQEVSLPVHELHKEVALFDLKDADFYEDVYGLYSVKFYIPKGTILAAYNRDGKVIRTIERFKNVKLPFEVRDAVTQRFPMWSITEDVYYIKYSEGKTQRQYKITMTNGDKKMKVKVDANGNFL